MSKFKEWTLKKYVAIKHGGEDGQGLAEYGLILALIAVVCIVALRLLGTNLNAKLGSVNAAF
jgi:pilus assembly protein Flp/PilA